MKRILTLLGSYRRLRAALKMMLKPLAIILFVLPRVALSYDGVVTGQIKRVDFKANVSHQALAIILEGDPALCGAGTPSATYVDEGNSMYATLSSAALAGLISGLTVTLRSNFDGVACQLLQVTVYN